MQVFSVEAYCENMNYPDTTRIEPGTWQAECDGKPVIDGMCGIYIIPPVWCKEVPDVGTTNAG